MKETYLQTVDPVGVTGKGVEALFSLRIPNLLERIVSLNLFGIDRIN